MAVFVRERRCASDSADSERRKASRKSALWLVAGLELRGALNVAAIAAEVRVLVERLDVTLDQYSKVVGGNRKGDRTVAVFEETADDDLALPISSFGS